MIRPLLTLGLCLFSYSLIAQELPLSTHVQKTSLTNGITVYIENSPSADVAGSFKVIFNNPSLGHTLYTLDTRLDDPDAVEDFFLSCAEKAEESACSSRHFIHGPPLEIAVIAVGNFATADLLSLIEDYFGEIELATADDHESIYINYSNELRPHHVAVNIAHPNHYAPIHTLLDLKECWKALFLQELIQQRFEECIRGFQGIWIHPYPQTFYPLTGFALAPEEEVENTLAFLLWQIEIAKQQGFYSEIFAAKKHHLLHKLHYLLSSAHSLHPSFLSSFYKDQFLLGGYSYEPQTFLNASIACVEEIELADLEPLLDSFLSEQSSQIHISYPHSFHLPPLTESRIKELKLEIASLAATYAEEGISDENDYEEKNDDHCFLLHTHPAAGSLIRRANNAHSTDFQLTNTNNSATDPFYALSLSERDKEIISTILSTLAENNIIKLAFLRRDLDKKGKKIEHIHPLRFMGYILSSPQLKSYARTMKKSSLKWDAFIDGFSRRMREEANRGNLALYVPGFAETVGSTPDHVNHYIHKRDWAGLVKSLL